MVAQQWLTVEQIAERLQVTEETVRRWCVVARCVAGISADELAIVCARKIFRSS
jgi:hypothetical protein